MSSPPAEVIGIRYDQANSENEASKALEDLPAVRGVAARALSSEECFGASRSMKLRA